MEFWTQVYQVFTVALQSVVVITLIAIARSVGAWEQWRKWAEEHLKDLGVMAQQTTKDVAEIKGRLGSGRKD